MFASLIPLKHRRHIRGSVARQISIIVLITFGIIVYRRSVVNVSENAQMNERHILQSDSILFVPTFLSRGHRRNLLPEDRGLRRDGVESTVVLVFAAKRPAAIRNHLEQLLRFRPSAEMFPVVISQDGVHEETTSVIKGFVNDTGRVRFIHHSERTGTGSLAQKVGKNYFFIAQHYKWALDKVFLEMNYTHAIVTEDDLDIAEDFFSYFVATRELLRLDPTIWCISAWNDNGGVSLTDRKRSETLYRTDFFPGLGWMLTAQLWKELSPNWPEMYWDDWLRRQDVRRNRACIRPEVSRTAHNNKVAGKGSSGGLYKQYLASIQLPESPIDFSLLDLAYLVKGDYDRILAKRLVDAKQITIGEVVAKSFQPDNAYRVTYSTPREYRRIAEAVGLMNDIRSGMVRTAYYGVVTFFSAGSRVYVVSAKLNLTEGFGSKNSSDLYDEQWDKMNKFLDFEKTYCRPGRFTGKCDPKSPELIQWFADKKIPKRLVAWGEMIVN